MIATLILKIFLGLIMMSLMSAAYFLFSRLLRRWTLSYQPWGEGGHRNDVGLGQALLNTASIGYHRAQRGAEILSHLSPYFFVSSVVGYAVYLSLTLPFYLKIAHAGVPAADFLIRAIADRLLDPYASVLIFSLSSLVGLVVYGIKFYRSDLNYLPNAMPATRVQLAKSLFGTPETDEAPQPAPEKNRGWIRKLIWETFYKDGKAEAAHKKRLIQFQGSRDKLLDLCQKSTYFPTKSLVEIARQEELFNLVMSWPIASGVEHLLEETAETSIGPMHWFEVACHQGMSVATQHFLFQPGLYSGQTVSSETVEKGIKHAIIAYEHWTRQPINAFHGDEKAAVALKQRSLERILTQLTVWQALNTHRLSTMRPFQRPGLGYVSKKNFHRYARMAQRWFAACYQQRASGLSWSVHPYTNEELPLPELIDNEFVRKNPGFRDFLLQNVLASFACFSLQPQDRPAVRWFGQSERISAETFHLTCDLADHIEARLGALDTKVSDKLPEGAALAVRNFLAGAWRLRMQGLYAAQYAFVSAETFKGEGALRACSRSTLLRYRTVLLRYIQSKYMASNKADRISIDVLTGCFLALEKALQQKASFWRPPAETVLLPLCRMGAWRVVWSLCREPIFKRQRESHKNTLMRAAIIAGKHAHIELFFSDRLSAVHPAIHSFLKYLAKHGPGAVSDDLSLAWIQLLHKTQVPIERVPAAWQPRLKDHLKRKTLLNTINRNPHQFRPFRRLDVAFRIRELAANSDEHTLLREYIFRDTGPENRAIVAYYAGLFGLSQCLQALATHFPAVLIKNKEEKEAEEGKETTSVRVSSGFEASLKQGWYIQAEQTLQNFRTRYFENSGSDSPNALMNEARFIQTLDTEFLKDLFPQINASKDSRAATLWVGLSKMFLQDMVSLFPRCSEAAAMAALDAIRSKAEKDPDIVGYLSGQTFVEIDGERHAITPASLAVHFIHQGHLRALKKLSRLFVDYPDQGSAWEDRVLAIKQAIAEAPGQQDALMAWFFHHPGWQDREEAFDYFKRWREDAASDALLLSIERQMLCYQCQRSTPQASIEYNAAPNALAIKHYIQTNPKFENSDLKENEAVFDSLSGLLLACQQRRLDAVLPSLLNAHGGDSSDWGIKSSFSLSVLIAVPDQHQKSVLHYACEYGWASVLSQLDAACRGSGAWLRWLLKEEAGRVAPLELAVASAQQELIDWIFEKMLSMEGHQLKESLQNLNCESMKALFDRMNAIMDELGWTAESPSRQRLGYMRMLFEDTAMQRIREDREVSYEEFKTAIQWRYLKKNLNEALLDPDLAARIQADQAMLLHHAYRHKALFAFLLLLQTPWDFAPDALPWANALASLSANASFNRLQLNLLALYYRRCANPTAFAKALSPIHALASNKKIRQWACSRLNRPREVPSRPPPDFTRGSLAAVFLHPLDFARLALAVLLQDVNALKGVLFEYGAVPVSLSLAQGKTLAALAEYPSLDGLCPAILKPFMQRRAAECRQAVMQYFDDAFGPAHRLLRGGLKGYQSRLLNRLHSEPPETVAAWLAIKDMHQRTPLESIEFLAKSAKSTDFRKRCNEISVWLSRLQIIVSDFSDLWAPASPDLRRLMYGDFQKPSSVWWAEFSLGARKVFMNEVSAPSNQSDELFAEWQFLALVFSNHFLRVDIFEREARSIYFELTLLRYMRSPAQLGGLMAQLPRLDKSALSPDFRFFGGSIWALWEKRVWDAKKETPVSASALVAQQPSAALSLQPEAPALVAVSSIESEELSPQAY